MSEKDKSTPSPEERGRHDTIAFALELRGLLASAPAHLRSSLRGQLRLSAVLVDQAVRLLESKVDGPLARKMLRAMLTEARPAAGQAAEVPGSPSRLRLVTSEP